MNGDRSLDLIVDDISALLSHRIGLRPEPSLRSRLRRCVRDDAASRGQNQHEYFDALRNDDDALQGLVDRVTVQETSFFRHPEHFEVLTRDVLPGLGQPVVFWSSACANGQEAFSLAMVLEEQGIEGYVVASDLSASAVRRTAAATYTGRELSGLSAQRIARHVTRYDDGWVVNQPIRDRVRVRQHNLLDPLPEEVRFADVVFCRNVLIYLTAEHAERLLDRIAAFRPSVTLFVGAAETIWQLTARFETVRHRDTFTYRPRTTSPDLSRAFPPLPAEPRPASKSAPPRPAAPPPTRSPARPTTVANPLTTDAESHAAVLLTRAGQHASAAGDVQAAIVAFRRCAYLTPHDPMAHLHLGLALELAGDQQAAGRAYAAARHALHGSDADHVDLATEGYTLADLTQLLDDKQQALTS